MDLGAVTLAIAAFVLGGVFNGLVGVGTAELTAKRAEARLKERETREGIRRIALARIAETRAFLLDEAAAMRRHVDWGANVVRPTLREYPRASLALVRDSPSNEMIAALAAQVYESVGGSKDQHLRDEIDAYELAVVRALLVAEHEVELDKAPYLHV